MNGSYDPPPHATARPARAKRSARDWWVDIISFALAAGFSFMTAGPVVEDPDLTELTVFLDQVTGTLACTALWLRRRWPVQLAVVVLLASMASHFVVGPTMVAMFTVAVHRPFRTVAAIGGLSLACSLVNGLVHTDPDLGYLGSVLAGALLYATAIGWGMFVRSRRQLVDSLRDRAHRAEAEAALRAERAQRLTRERIAREMHDVLAHRLSLLSVHAGALEYRPGAPPDDIAQAAGVIRDSAHQALEDLREVIGVLRAPIGQPAAPAGSTVRDGAGGAETVRDRAGGAEAVRDGPSGAEATGGAEPAHGAGGAGGVTFAGAVPSRPQPTLADLPRLVAESRQAAMRVTLRDETGQHGEVPAATGRTAYRIVQEGLTNTRKHAPDAEVTVRVTGTPERGLTVEVRDWAAALVQGAPVRSGKAEGAARKVIPGSGQGLIGLTERASLAGGYLESGATQDGGFLLRAWLPWPS
ncbi:sensor histidine kinase [Streptomyces zagrosensis]|uniref:histidine kinase n=1 Tax=Streptomyces zagrosensis TaxID=1042984 RepID=A0A7W9QAB7_9ACTN|nr:histidine kinase [Streptomyces zagrosensis]MBB5936088.1 signal transduction histidine kinase [Streptomyces zagrosensis]